MTSYQQEMNDTKEGPIEHLDHVPVGLDSTHFAHMNAEERAAAFKLAHEKDPGPAVMSIAYLRFFLSLCVVIVCSCDTGFDTTIMSSVNSMTQFQGFFGLASTSPSTGILFVSV
jgi:hypothetical protein